MARKKKEQDFGGGYSWMDTYGDMVTLLLTFFVLLFSFSSVDEAKWKLLVESFTGMPPTAPVSVAMSPINLGGSNFTSDPTSGASNMQQQADNNTGEGTGQQSQAEIEEEFDELYATIRAYIQENNLNSALVAEKLDNVIYLRVLDGILFDSGRAEIKQTEDMILDDIGRMFYSSINVINQVRVEGHTDNVPIHNVDYEDNWDLSTKRATNVIRYLHTRLSIPTEKLSVGAYAEYQPVASNDTPEGRAQNRRVTFIISRQDLVENE